MEHEDESFVIYEGVVVPESALLRRERKNPYGSVEGLDDEELADPAELERQVFRQEWGPVLDLPLKGTGRWIKPAIDENGQVDWGAFGTVDWDRTTPDFDKAKCKARELREELGNLLISLELSKEHVPGKAKYAVLRYLERGVIDIDHIDNVDMLILARQYLRARKLQREIAELEESIRRQKRKEYEKWMRS